GFEGVLGAASRTAAWRPAGPYHVAAALALPAIGQLAHEVGAADQPDQLTLTVDHRDALEPLGDQQRAHAIERGRIGHGNDRTGHDLAHAPPGACDQVVLADDADDAAIDIDH